MSRDCASANGIGHATAHTPQKTLVVAGLLSLLPNDAGVVNVLQLCGDHGIDQIVTDGDVKDVADRGTLARIRESFENIVVLNELSFAHTGWPTSFLPTGWAIVFGVPSASHYSGGLAMDLARETTRSVICLGMQDSAIIGETNGNPDRALWGVELSSGSGGGRGTVSGLRNGGLLVLDHQTPNSEPCLIEADRQGGFTYNGIMYGRRTTTSAA